DPFLLSGEHGVAGGERWLETDPLDRYGSAMNTPQHAGAFQRGQIAPDCLRRHRELVGERGHIDATERPGLLEDLPLPLFRVHVTSPPFPFLLVPCLRPFMLDVKTQFRLGRRPKVSSGGGQLHPLWSDPMAPYAAAAPRTG